jgi:hypothetical protein
MTITYKQKCSRCKKNYVVTTWKQRYVNCYDCQKNELSKTVKNPELKKLLDIPDEYYRDNAFLRNIKISCLQFGRLTDKQIEAFKKVAQKMKEDKSAQAPAA